MAYDRNPDDRLEIGYVLSSNECFRDPCQNEDWLSDLATAREKIAQWERSTGEKPPHQHTVPYSVALTAQAELGQKASYAGPLPHTPIPLQSKGCGANQNRRKPP